MKLALDKDMNQSLSLVWQEIKEQGWRFIAYFLVIVAVGITSILPPKFYGYFAENVAFMQTMDANSASGFVQHLIIFGSILGALLFISNFLRVFTEEWLCLRVEANLRCRFMGCMQRMPLDIFDDSQRGDWLTRMSGDIRTVEQFIAIKIPQQLLDFVIMLGIAILFTSQNGKIALLLLGSAAFMAWGNYVIQRQINPMLENLRDLHGQVFQGLLESFEGMRSIRSYKAENFVLQNFSVRVQIIIFKGLRMIRIVGLLLGTNSLVVNLLTAGVLSFVALKLRANSLLISDVFLYPFYIGMFYTSVFALVRGIFDWNDFFIHARRLNLAFEKGALPKASQTKNEKIASTLKFASNLSLNIKEMQLGYEGFRALTKPFDFQLNQKEVLVVRGHSGCGKSTFLETLAGLRKIQAAQTTLQQDDWESTNIDLLPVELSTYVEQRAFLLEGTLRSNLEFKNEQVTEKALWSALEDVDLAAFFKEYNGLDFFITDNGRNLSEGQKQRIGLARALLHPRPFLFLDEPFAALDRHSIASFCKALAKLKEKHGIVIVSHVIPEELHFDRIIEFDSFSNSVENDSTTCEDFSEPMIREEQQVHIRFLADDARVASLAEHTVSV